MKQNDDYSRRDIYLVTGSYSLANLQITTTHGCGIFGDSENQPTSTPPSGTTTHDLKEDFKTFRVDDDGNVGIGTTNPLTKLHVVGDVAISSNLAVDTNTLFVDSVGNKVGIGNTNPSQILDVGSSLSNPFICRDLSGSLHDQDKRDSVSFGRIDESSFLGMKCRVDTHTALGYGDVANQTKIGFFTWGNNYNSSEEVMSILGNGNVGIGTTTPGTALDVVGTVTATGQVKGATVVGTHYGTISGSNAAAVSSLTATGQVKGATVVGTSGVYGTISGSNTAAVSSLTASGQVKGATVVGTSGVYGKIMGSNTAAVTTLTASGVIAGATGVNGTPLVLNVGRGDVTFEYNTYDRGNDDGAGITIRTSANPVLDSMFAVRSSGHASRLWVGQDLTSVGSNQLCAGFSGADGTEGVLDSYKFIVKTNGDVAISSNLAVDTNTLFVDSVGNKVGIGTTSPLTRLHVNHDLYLGASSEAWSTTAGKGLYLRYSLTGSQDGAYIQSIDRRNTSLSYPLEFQASLYNFTVGNAIFDGNVGIGTATPRGGLDVRTGDGSESDTHATFGKAVYASVGWSGIRLGTPYASAHDAYCSVIESYNNHFSNYNSELRFKTSSGNNAVATERMRIASNGNVGIGTNNPETNFM